MPPSWFIIPLNIDISPINHSYWSYVHQLSYRTGAPHNSRSEKNDNNMLWFQQFCHHLLIEMATNSGIRYPPHFFKQTQPKYNVWAIIYIYIYIDIYIYNMSHSSPTTPTFLWIPGLPTVDQSSPGRIDIPRSCRWCRSGQWLGCGQ